MKRIFAAVCVFLTVLTLCAIPALAAGEGPSVSVPETEILLDPTSGQFRFTIEIDSRDSYAGAEFGVYCSQGTEITSVTAASGSVTGPQAANGLVWFGFFDGQDSFTGTTTITVEGTCQTGTDGAVAIQDVKLYTIGDQEYATTTVECGAVVNLYWELPVAAEPAEEAQTPDNGMNVTMLILCCAVIAAAAAGAFIYRNHKNTQKNQKEKEHASEQTEE